MYVYTDWLQIVTRQPLSFNPHHMREGCGSHSVCYHASNYIPSLKIRCIRFFVVYAFSRFVPCGLQ